MAWSSYIKGFKSYLRLEKSLSENSIEAYLHDITLFDQYLITIKTNVTPSDVTLKHLQNFITWINELSLSAKS